MMQIESKIKFLWDCARSLKGDKQTHKLLKSHYINICRNISKPILQIPKEKFAISQMCPFCSCFWIESEFSLKLKSQKVANNSKTSKLLDILDKSEDGSYKRNLSKKQKNRAKWLKKRVKNCIEIKCHQCKHKSVVQMQKPENRIETNFNDQITRPKNKIKFKKSETKIPHDKAKDFKNIKAFGSTKSKKLSKPHECYVNPQSTQHEHKTKVKKINKVVSKTQKQNSILQLAALLKNQLPSNAKNLTQKRLEALLK